MVETATTDGRRDPRLTDPDAAELVAALARARRLLAPPPQAGVDETRRRAEVPPPPDPAVVSIEDRPIAGGSPGLSARVYRPAAGKPTGVILYLHGGGWMLGGPSANQGLCVALCVASGAVLVSLDYRLAPEHPFPAALDDTEAALDWLASGGAAELGVPDRGMAVVGHSAGGALAAAAVNRARLAGPAIAHQVLLCPVLDHDATRGSYDDFGEGLLLTREEMAWYWDLYLPDPALRSHPDASPLRARELAGLPATTVVAGGADLLRDEALEYAESLIAAGVDTRVILHPGVPHLFLLYPQIRSRDAVVDAVAARLREAFELHRPSHSAPEESS